MWRCKQCHEWIDDPPYTLDACPECGFDGEKVRIRDYITLSQNRRSPQVPLRIHVNGDLVPYREFTPEELEPLERDFQRLKTSSLADSRPPLARLRFVFLLTELHPGDDITYNGLGPEYDEIWVRFNFRNPADQNTTVGNMRLNT